MEICSVVLTFEFVDEILWTVTIQINPPWQYFCMVSFNPLIPNMKIEILFFCSCSFLIAVRREKLVKYQDNSSQMIFSLILMTFLIGLALILPGEI